MIRNSKKKVFGKLCLFTCPLVETADMETVVMTVTTLDKVMSRRPWTRPGKDGSKNRLCIGGLFGVKKYIRAKVASPLTPISEAAATAVAAAAATTTRTVAATTAAAATTTRTTTVATTTTTFSSKNSNNKNKNINHNNSKNSSSNNKNKQQHGDNNNNNNDYTDTYMYSPACPTTQVSLRKSITPQMFSRHLM